MVECCLWIIYLELSSLFKEIMANLNSWRLSWVISIFFKGSSEDANRFALEVKVEGLENP